MTPSVLQEPHHCEGPGWTAAAYYGYVILSVHPDIEDALDLAIDELLSKTQQRYWLLDFMHDSDMTGWEVYRLERDGQRLLDDTLGLQQKPA